MNLIIGVGFVPKKKISQTRNCKNRRSLCKVTPAILVKGDLHGPKEKNIGGKTMERGALEGEPNIEEETCRP